MISQPEDRAERTAVTLFARAPGSKAAKTRLRGDLGDGRADAIYRWMLSRSLKLRRRRAPGQDWFVFVDQRPGLPWFERNAHGWDIRVQVPGSLGNRLDNAFAILFEGGYGAVIIVGCDIPELTPRHLTSAEFHLQGCPVVLGPCNDGGYYLIGQRAPGGRLFSGIQWGQSQVYRDTLRLAAQAGLDVATLPSLHDIDTGEDWRALILRLAEGKKLELTPESKPATSSLLSTQADQCRN